MKNLINVLVDSSTDLDPGNTYIYNPHLIPFHVFNDMSEIYTFESLDCSKPITSSCPSPNNFYKHLIGHDESYIVTMSSKMSDSYNSAIIAKNRISEETQNSFIHVFDSKGSSACQTLITLKIYQLVKENFHKRELVEKVETYIDSLKVLFISESMDNLTQSSRLSSMKKKVTSLLRIKFIMTVNSNGEAICLDKAYHSKKSVVILIEYIKKHTKSRDKNIAAISHVNNLANANLLKAVLLEEMGFKKVLISKSSLINAVYCGNRGLAVSF